MKCKFVALWLLACMAPVAHADELYKCENPPTPLRFATSEESKDRPPPCGKWVEIRGISISTASSLEGKTFQAANLFLAEVASTEAKWMSFPVVLTTDLYEEPERYGFTQLPCEDAEVGSFAIYRGLAGVVVETREDERHPWVKRLLYPSKVAGFTPVIADVGIPGEGEAVCIEPQQSAKPMPAIREGETELPPRRYVAGRGPAARWEGEAATAEEEGGMEEMAAEGEAAEEGMEAAEAEPPD